MAHLKLQRVPNISLVMDLCLLNAIVGISSHGGKYACTFCDGTNVLDSGILCTFSHLKEKYKAYQAAGANPAKMSHYSNGEAAHHATKVQMQRYKRSEDNPAHGKVQKEAVAKFSSWNVFNMTQLKRPRRES